jgi:hypothetical protein
MWKIVLNPLAREGSKIVRTSDMLLFDNSVDGIRQPNRERDEGKNSSRQEPLREAGVRVVVRERPIRGPRVNRRWDGSQGPAHVSHGRLVGWLELRNTLASDPG